MCKGIGEQRRCLTERHVHLIALCCWSWQFYKHLPPFPTSSSGFVAITYSPFFIEMSNNGLRKMGLFIGSVSIQLHYLFSGHLFYTTNMGRLQASGFEHIYPLKLACHPRIVNLHLAACCHYSCAIDVLDLADAVVYMSRYGEMLKNQCSRN